MERPSVRLAGLVCAAILIATAISAAVRVQGAVFERSLVRAFPVGVLAVALVVAFGGPAHAQDAASLWWRTPRLEFQTVPGCPDLAMFRHELALQGSDKFDPDPEAPNVVYVTFAKRGGIYSGTSKVVLTSGPWPAETVTSLDCMAAGFVRTVAFNAVRGLPKPPVTGAPPPEEPPPPDLSALPELPPPEVPPGTAKVPSMAWRFVPPPPAWPPPLSNVGPHPLRSFNEFRWYMNLSLSLSGLVLLSMGYSDNVAPAVGVGLEFRGTPPTWNGFGLSLGLEFRGVPPSRVTAREPFDPAIKATIPVEVDVSTWSGLVVPCLRFAKYFSACAVGQLGVRVNKTPFLERSSYTGRLGPRLGVEIPFTERFAVIGLGEALFSPTRPGFAFKDPPINNPDGQAPNVSWREPVVAGFIGVGLSVRFE